MVKQAEVAGVLAGLVDADLIKIASEEDFEVITDVVAENLSNDYDLDEVLAKTAEVFEYLEEVDGEPLEKTAEEEYVEAMAALGEATMDKLAGELDDEEFEKIAASIADLASKAIHGDLSKIPGAIGSGLRGAKDYLVKGLKGSGIKKSLKARTGLKNYTKDYANYMQELKAAKRLGLPTGLAKKQTKKRFAEGFKQVNKALKGDAGALRRRALRTGLAYGGAAAATGGAAYGGKKLYDKYAK